MVRETRYLLVRNLPEKCTEEAVNNHFQRYGKIQSVKLHLNKESDGGPAATVAFMDIKSASKAHGAENLLENCVLRTEYCEGSTTGSIVTRTHEPDRGTFHVPSGSAARGTGSFPWQKGSGTYPGRQGRTPVEGYGTEKEGYDRTRATSPPHSLSGSRQGDSGSRIKSVSISRSPSQSRSRSPRSRSRSSSSGSWSSHSSRSRSRSRSPGSSHGSRLQGSVTAGCKLPSVDSKDSQLDKQKSDDQSSNAERKPLGICVTGLPLRSSDTSLRDGLFHEYKKHGKVTSVQVAGESTDRYAVVSFRRPEDASKALEASQDKMFFGTRIKVSQHEGVEVDDTELRPSESELDEYHPKATRTLFVGNLEKDTTVSDLVEIFKDFGEIIDVDIKRQGAASAYAFVQYADIVSVVKALRQMEGEHIGANKVKLGFGKSMPTNCIWLDNVGDNVGDKYLCRVFSRYGEVSHDVIDRNKGRALVYFTNLDDAQYAVNEMRSRSLGGKKIQIDFASRECQNKFFDKMEKTGQLRPGEWPDERAGSRFRRNIDFTENFQEENRTSSFNTPTQFNKKGFFRGTRSSRGSSTTYRDRGRGTSEFQEEFTSRRQRSSEGYTQGGSGEYFKTEDSYEQELREYGHSQRQRERGHSSPRRNDDRYDERPSRRSSRDLSLDSYDERSKDRIELYRRSESPGSDRNSYRSESRYRSRSDDKTYSRDRFDLDKHRDYDLHSDPSRSQSPVSFHSPTRSPTRRKDDELSNRSYTPPTPTEEEPPMYGYYPNEYSRKSRSERSNSVHRHVSIDDSVAKPQPWSVVSVTSGKPQSEIVKPPEKMSSRKRSYEEAMLSKDLAKISKKLERSESHSTALKSTASKISVTKPFQLDKLRLEKGTRLMPKAFIDGQFTGSPGSTNSHPESENGSLGESDLLELHTKKALLLQKIQEIEDTSEVDPHLSEDVRNVVARRLEGSKILKSLHSGKLEEKKLELAEEIKKIDSTKSYRKQMEKLRILETKVSADDLTRRRRSPSAVIPIMTKLDDSESEDQHIESPSDISASFRQQAKRRKFDVKEGDLTLKVRTYRRNDKSLSSDDELTDKNLKKKELTLDSYSKNVKLHDGLAKLDVGYTGYFPLSKSPRHDIHAPLELVDKKPLPRIIKEESDTTLEDPRIKRHQHTFDDRITSSAVGKEVSPHVVPADSSTNSPKEEQLTFVIQNSPEYLKSPKMIEDVIVSHHADDVSEHSPKDIHLATKTWTRPVPYETESVPMEITQEKGESEVEGVVDSTSVVTTVKDESSPLPAVSETVLDLDDCFSDSSLEEPKTPGELSLEERIRILDEKMSNSVLSKPIESQLHSQSSSSPTLPSSLPTNLYSKFRIRKKQDAVSALGFSSGSDEKKTEPSDIVKQLLSRRSRSILDQDSKRLEQINEKYEPKDVTVTLANSPPKSFPQVQTKAAVKQMPVASMSAFQGVMGSFNFDNSNNPFQPQQTMPHLIQQHLGHTSPLPQQHPYPSPSVTSPHHVPAQIPTQFTENTTSSHHTIQSFTSPTSPLQTHHQQQVVSTSTLHSRHSPTTIANAQLSPPCDKHTSTNSTVVSIQPETSGGFQSVKQSLMNPDTQPRQQHSVNVSAPRVPTVEAQHLAIQPQLVVSTPSSSVSESVSSSTGTVAMSPVTTSVPVPSKDSHHLTAPIQKRRLSDSFANLSTSHHSEPTNTQTPPSRTVPVNRSETSSTTPNQPVTSATVTTQETKSDSVVSVPVKTHADPPVPKKDVSLSKEDKETKHALPPVLMRSKSTDEKASKLSKLTSLSKSFEVGDKKLESSGEKKKESSHKSHDSHSQHSVHKDKSDSKKDEDRHHHKISSSSDKKISKSHSQEKEHKEEKKHESTSHKDKCRHDSGTKSKSHKEAGDSAGKDKIKAKHKDNEAKKDHASEKSKPKERCHDDKKHDKERKIEERKSEEKKDDKRTEDKKEDRRVEDKKEEKKNDEKTGERKSEDKKQEKKDKVKNKENKLDKVKSSLDSKSEKAVSKSQDKVNNDNKDGKKSSSSSKDKTQKDSKDQKRKMKDGDKTEKTSKSGSKTEKRPEASKDKSDSKSGKEKSDKKEDKKDDKKEKERERKEKKAAAVNERKMLEQFAFDDFEPYVSMYDKVKRRSIEKSKENEMEDVRKCFDRFQKSRKQKGKSRGDDSDSSFFNTDDESAMSGTQSSEHDEPEPPKEKARKKKTQIIESSSSDELEEYIKQKRKKKSKTPAPKKVCKFLDSSSDMEEDMDIPNEDVVFKSTSKKTAKKRKSRDDWSDEDNDFLEEIKVEKRLEDRSFVDAFPSEMSITEPETMDEGDKKISDPVKNEKSKKPKKKKPKEKEPTCLSKTKKKEVEKPKIEEEEEVFQLEDLIRKELKQMEANVKKAEAVKEKPGDDPKNKMIEDQKELREEKKHDELKDKKMEEMKEKKADEKDKKKSKSDKHKTHKEPRTPKVDEKMDSPFCMLKEEKKAKSKLEDKIPKPKKSDSKFDNKIDDSKMSKVEKAETKADSANFKSKVDSKIEDKHLKSKSDSKLEDKHRQKVEVGEEETRTNPVIDNKIEETEEDMKTKSVKTDPREKKSKSKPKKTNKELLTDIECDVSKSSPVFTSIVRDPEKNIFSEMHKLSDFGNKQLKVEHAQELEQNPVEKHSSQDDDSDKDLTRPKVKKAKKKKKKKDGKVKENKVDGDERQSGNNSEKRDSLFSSMGQKSSKLVGSDISELAKEAYDFDVTQDSILEKFECKSFGDSKKDGSLFGKSKYKSSSNDSSKFKDPLKDKMFMKDSAKDDSKDITEDATIIESPVNEVQVQKATLLSEPAQSATVENTETSKPEETIDVISPPKVKPDVPYHPPEVEVKDIPESGSIDSSGFNSKSEAKKTKKGTKKEKNLRSDKPKKAKKKDKEKYVPDLIIEETTPEPTQNEERAVAEDQVEDSVQQKPVDSPLYHPKDMHEKTETLEHVDSSPEFLKAFDFLTSPSKDPEKSVAPDEESKKSPVSFQSPKKDSVIQHDEFMFDDSNDTSEAFQKKELDIDWTKRFKPTFEEAKSADDSPRSLEEMDPKKLVIHFPEEKDDTDTQEDLTIHLGIPNTASLPKIPSSMAEPNTTEATGFSSVQGSEDMSSISMMSPEHNPPDDAYPTYSDITNDEKAAQAASDEAALAVASILFDDQLNPFKSEVPEIPLHPSEEHIDEPVLDDKDRLSDAKEAEAAIAHIQKEGFSPSGVSKVEIDSAPTEKEDIETQPPKVLVPEVDSEKDTKNAEKEDALVNKDMDLVQRLNSSPDVSVQLAADKPIPEPSIFSSPDMEHNPFEENKLVIVEPKPIEPGRKPTRRTRRGRRSARNKGSRDEVEVSDHTVTDQSPSEPLNRSGLSSDSDKWDFEKSESEDHCQPIQPQIDQPRVLRSPRAERTRGRGGTRRGRKPRACNVNKENTETVDTEPIKPNWSEEKTRRSSTSDDSFSGKTYPFSSRIELSESLMSKTDEQEKTDSISYSYNEPEEGNLVIASEEDDKPSQDITSTPQRSTRNRKLPNYKAMVSGTSPRPTRSSTSPRAQRGEAQSPKNTSPRGRGSPKPAEIGSPVVKLEKLEMDRGKKEGRKSEECKSYKFFPSFTEEKPHASKENIYEFETSEQDQEEKSELYPRLRSRKKKLEPASDPFKSESELVSYSQTRSSMPAPPLPTVTPQYPTPVTTQTASISTAGQTLTPAETIKNIMQTVAAEHAAEQSAAAAAAAAAQSYVSDDSSSSMSNVDKIIDAVSKGIFGSSETSESQSELGKPETADFLPSTPVPSTPSAEEKSVNSKIYDILTQSKNEVLKQEQIVKVEHSQPSRHSETSGLLSSFVSMQGPASSSTKHHPISDIPNMVQSHNPVAQGKLSGTSMASSAVVKSEDTLMGRLSSPAGILQLNESIQSLQQQRHAQSKPLVGPQGPPLTGPPTGPSTGPPNASQTGPQASLQTGLHTVLPGQQSGSVPTSTIKQNPAAIMNKSMTSHVSAPAQHKPKSIPQPIMTPPPPQMTTSGIQPQRPQSVQLPVSHIPVSSPDSMNIQRPPSAHSNAPFQGIQTSTRDPPKSVPQSVEAKSEPAKTLSDSKGKSYQTPIGQPPFMFPGQLGQRMPVPQGLPFIMAEQRMMSPGDPRLLSPVGPREPTPQTHSKEAPRKSLSDPHPMTPRDMSRPVNQGQMPSHYADMPRQTAAENMRQSHQQREPNRPPGPVEQMRQMAEAEMVKRHSASAVIAEQMRQRAQAEHLRKQMAAGEQMRHGGQSEQKRHLEEHMRREEQIRHRQDMMHHLRPDEHMQVPEAHQQGRSNDRQREVEAIHHMVRQGDDPQNLVRREQVQRAEAQRFADMQRHSGLERQTDIQRIVNQQLDAQVRQHSQSGPQSRMHGPSPDHAICVKTPPATSAANTLYAGVVAGHPSSLSPKTASPVGQVIERLPNPLRQGEHGHVSSQPSRMSYQEAQMHQLRQNKDADSPRNAATPQGEMRPPSREQQQIMFYMQQQQQQQQQQQHRQQQQQQHRQMMLQAQEAAARKTQLSEHPHPPQSPTALNLADPEHRPLQDGRTSKGSAYPVPYDHKMIMSQAEGRIPATTPSAFVPGTMPALRPDLPQAVPPHLYRPDLFPQGIRLPIDPRMYPGIEQPGFISGRDVSMVVPPAHFPPQILDKMRMEQHVEAHRSGRQEQGGPGMHPGTPAQPQTSRLGVSEMIHQQPILPPPPLLYDMPREKHLSKLGRYPVVWQGAVALKNDNSLVQMHYVAGNRSLPKVTLPPQIPGGALQPLRIAQRMRMEHSQLDGVSKRMQLEEDFCILLAIPYGRDQSDTEEQTKALTKGVIEYLLVKQAAGIVNIPMPGSTQPAYVVHIFPPCEFSHGAVDRNTSGLVEHIQDLAHALIIITTVG